jgi:N-acetylglucosaminyl-diphospho-decaprenol L-rhamnosyltransferase
VQEPSIDLTLIIVSYHSLEPLKAFFESYRRYPIHCSHEILVIDNAPGDGVSDWIGEEAPEARIIAMPRNVGYARAVNAGIEHAAGRAFLVINPDVELSENGVDGALDYLDAHPEVGIVGARLLNRDGSLQSSARRFYTLQTILLRRTPLARFCPNHPELRRHLMLDDDLNHPRPVDWVMGAWMLVRRAAVEAVGLMDERFFLYFEDVDWCYRMWARGFEVHYFPGAQFVHAYERSSGSLNRTLLYHLRSFASYYDKWGALIYVAKRLRRGWEKLSAFVLDMILLNLVFAGSYLLRLLLQPAFPLPLYSFAEYLPLLGFTNLVAALTLPLAGRYRSPRSPRPLSRWLESGRLAFMVTLLIMAGTFLSHTRTFSRSVILLLFPLLTLALLSSRAILRRLLGGGVGEERLARAALVGRAGAIEELRSSLTSSSSGTLVIVGHVLSGDPADQGPPGLRQLGSLAHRALSAERDPGGLDREGGRGLHRAPARGGHGRGHGSDCPALGRRAARDGGNGRASRSLVAVDSASIDACGRGLGKSGPRSAGRRFPVPFVCTRLRAMLPVGTPFRLGAPSGLATTRSSPQSHAAVGAGERAQRPATARCRAIAGFLGGFHRALEPGGALCDSSGEREGAPSDPLAKVRGQARSLGPLATGARRGRSGFPRLQ